MYTYQYPRPAVTVDIVLSCRVDDLVNILLVQRAEPPFQGSWALPGGFVDIDETLKAAAARELEEETGLRGVQLTQLRTYGDPGRDPRGRVISVVYCGELPAGKLEQGLPGSDAAQVRWFPISELPLLAFDHLEIIQESLAQ